MTVVDRGSAAGASSSGCRSASSHKHEAAADVRWNLAMYAAAYDLTITYP